MPRTESEDLTTIFEAYKRRDTLDIYLADETVLRLSRGAVIREIDGEDVEYQNYIRSVGDLNSSFEKSIDRIEIIGQNVNSELGFTLASDLRLLDYAVCDYGKSYQSIRNPLLIEDIPQVFRGVLADAVADEQFFSFELIVDYESLGNIIASRGLSPKCGWTYKNGMECTSASASASCTRTRRHCTKNGVQHEFGGWEFFDEPTSLLPGSGGNIGGGSCFTGETLIWTPKGSIPIGEMAKRMDKSIYSFNEKTGEIIEDEIVKVFRHKVTGYFTFDFEHASLNVTPEHRLFTAHGDFKAADNFRRGETVKAFIETWFNSKLKKIRWHSDKKATVWNLHVRKNQTYFANECGVHNAKNGEIIVFE